MYGKRVVCLEHVFELIARVGAGAVLATTAYSLLGES